MNVLVVLDRHVFCSDAIYHSIFTLETEVSKEAFREWYNCLWHILKFPIAQANHGAEAMASRATKIPSILGTPPASLSQTCLEPELEPTVLGVWMPPAKLPQLERQCWAERVTLFDIPPC